MPKAAGQKQKLILLARILWQETDEEHPLSVPELISALERAGVSAERKSIYSDLEALSDLGFDVEVSRGRKVGYYLASRTFELPELKLLVDAVQSSKFITEKKSRELIGKLEGLTDRHQAQELSRQVYVSGRIKTMNESIYYAIDDIHRAISRDRKLSFQYFSWNLDKERVLRRDGARYLVSPYALTWDDENYYLIAFDDEKQKLLHFRVDKMLHLKLADAPREGREAFASFDMAAYSRRVFGMFAGEEERVTLRLSANLIGVVIDRFGADLPILRDGEDHFRVTVAVQQSPQFFGWLCGVGKDAVLVSPASAREAYKHYLSETLAAQE